MGGTEMSFIPCDYCGKESPELQTNNVCDACNVELAGLGLQIRQIETPFGLMQSIEPKPQPTRGGLNKCYLFENPSTPT